MNNVLNAIIHFCAKKCHTITCTTFDVIIEKDRMGVLKRRLKRGWQSRPFSAVRRFSEVKCWSKFFFEKCFRVTICRSFNFYNLKKKERNKERKER